jgi:hypothetical protein
MELAFLPCRDLRHSWESIGDNVLIEDRGQVKHFTRTLECSRCECRRMDEYKMSRVALVLLRTRYDYPKGYQVKGGLRVSDARLMLFQDAVFVHRGEQGEPVPEAGA